MIEHKDNKEKDQGNELVQYLQQLDEIGQHSYDSNYWLSRNRLPPNTRIIADKTSRNIPKWAFLGFDILLLVCFSWLGWDHINSSEPDAALRDLIGIIIVGNIRIR